MLLVSVNFLGCFLGALWVGRAALAGFSGRARKRARAEGKHNVFYGIGYFSLSLKLAIEPSAVGNR